VLHTNSKSLSYSPLFFTESVSQITMVIYWWLFINTIIYSLFFNKSKISTFWPGVTEYIYIRSAYRVCLEHVLRYITDQLLNMLYVCFNYIVRRNYEHRECSIHLPRIPHDDLSGEFWVWWFAEVGNAERLYTTCGWIPSWETWCPRNGSMKYTPSLVCKSPVYRQNKNSFLVKH